MKPFRDLPIQRKMLLMTLLICGAVLLVAIAALFTFQVLNFRYSFQRDTATLAAIIANNSTAALAFKDAQAGAEVVNSLQAKPTVVAACLVEPDGSLFAKYGRPQDAKALAAYPPAGEFLFTTEHLLYTQPVVLDKKYLGTLYLRADFRRTFLELVGFYVQVTLGVMVVSIGLAVFLSSRLRRIITDPVLSLAQTAQIVGEKRDYSVRAPVESRGDELGRLTEGFNHMLGQIQTQDSALQAAQQQLARQVEELKERAQLASFDAVVGLTLTRNDSLEDILQQCTQAVVDYLGAAFARIWTLNRAQQVLELKASAGLYTHRNGAHQRVPVGQFKIGLIAARREPLMTNTVVGDSRVHDQVWAQREKMVSFAGIPLMVGDEVVGVLAMFGRQPITEAASQTLGSVANAIALGIERKRTEAALRENEERFRSLFENATIGLYRTNPAGDVLMANPTLLRMLGYDSMAEMSARNVAAESYADATQRARFTSLVESQGEIHGLEAAWKRRNGTEVFVRESAKAIRDASGDLLFYEGTVEDITERKKAEAELEKAHKELLEASRAAGMAEVATGVLHNVGNVLNSVSVSATLVNDRLKQSKVANLRRATNMLREQNGNLVEYLSTDPKGKLLPEYLRSVSDQLATEQAEILDEVALLTQNIDHIKEIVAMQQSYAKVSGAFEHLQPTELVEDALRMNAAAFERHRIEVTREYSDPLPRVNVDRHKVLQILINVLRNAKYALDNGNPENKRLVVRVEPTADGRVAIRVRDNGVGISAENLSRIFGHGFTTKRDGHGFGLHSGANAAREMGGRLFAESDGLGQGACFTLELPVAPAKFATEIKLRADNGGLQTASYIKPQPNLDQGRSVLTLPVNRPEKETVS